MIILSTVVKHTLKCPLLILQLPINGLSEVMGMIAETVFKNIVKERRMVTPGREIGKGNILCSELCSPCLIQKYFQTEFFSVVFKLCYILKLSFMQRDPGKHLCRVCTKQSVNLANLSAGPNLHRFTVFTAPKYLRNTLKLGLH